MSDELFKSGNSFVRIFNIIISQRFVSIIFDKSKPKHLSLPIFVATKTSFITNLCGNGKIIEFANSKPHFLKLISKTPTFGCHNEYNLPQNIEQVN